MYLYAGKVVWDGPPGVSLLKNAGVENRLVWFYLCMFSSSVGDYICQYTPSAIAHSLIPRQSSQWFSPWTNAVIKVHFSTLKHTFLSAEVFFFMQDLHLKKSGQANILLYHSCGCRFMSQSIPPMLQHPSIPSSVIAPLKAFPFLWFMLVSSFHPF